MPPGGLTHNSDNKTVFHPLVLVSLASLFIILIAFSSFSFKDYLFGVLFPTRESSASSLGIGGKCQSGVRSFSVEESCGGSSFRYAKYLCSDGYSGRAGDPSRCRSLQTWLSYVREICSSRSSCTTSDSVNPLSSCPQPPACEDGQLVPGDPLSSDPDQCPRYLCLRE